MRLEDKRKAIELRQKGFTYNEIKEIIPSISKGTLSGWLKNIDLSNIHKERILDKIKDASQKGRVKGAWVNKKKREDRIKKIQKEAKKEFRILAQKPLFLIGLSLYFAEGTHKFQRFQFVNSDPRIIKLMMAWLKKVFRISDENINFRLYLHEIYSNEGCEEFWADIVNVPVEKFLKTVYKPTLHRLKKNLLYKGCLRIEVRGSELFWKIQTWQNMLTEISN